MRECPSCHGPAYADHCPACDLPKIKHQGSNGIPRPVLRPLLRP